MMAPGENLFITTMWRRMPVLAQSQACASWGTVWGDGNGGYSNVMAGVTVTAQSTASATVDFMAAQNPSIVWPAIFAGRAYQSSFNAMYNVGSNTARFLTKFGRVIPDLAPGNGVLELKASQYVYNSSQILGEMELATSTEVPYFLAVSPQSAIANTTLSSISNLLYGGQALVFDAEAGTVAAYDGWEVSAAFWEMIAAGLLEE